MFRLGARRCARLQASIVAAPSVLTRARVSMPSIQSATASISRSHTPLKTASWLSRAYSGEATAQRTSESASAPPTKFNDLTDIHPALKDAVTRGMGYETMTPVQALTIAPALKGTDLVAQAKTGTGKTLAFLLPIFQRIISDDPTLATRSSARRANARDIRGIVLSPTRELAEQIAVEARNLAKNTGIVVQVAVGGTSKQSMLRQTQRQGCHLLVATPGRLADVLQDEYAGIAAPRLAAIVLDEADRMLDVGFEKEIHQILDCLPSQKEVARQTMLVSATIPEDVIDLARRMVRADDFQFVQTIGENESLTHDRVPQHLVPISTWANMIPTLFEIIDKEIARIKATPGAPPFKAIVYINTTAGTDLISQMGFDRKRTGPWRDMFIGGIQSRMSQEKRQRTADMFRNASSGILFSSDVTARGMDFPNVTDVFQVDGARERETYIHRIGRTARQDKEGQGWLLVTDAGVASMRRTLRGLPLKPNDSFADVARAHHDGGDMPPIFESLKETAHKLPRDAMNAAYTSFFGGLLHNKDSLAQELHETWTSTFGLDSPPGVSKMWASKMGLARSNYLNFDQGRFSPGGYDSAPNGNGRGFSRDRAPSSGDPFDDMRENVRSDRPRPGGFGGSRGSRPRSGGFGGSRGGFQQRGRY